MWIVKLALARPYTFIVFSLVLLLISPVVLLRTPVDIFPSINIPVISVIWTYTGLVPSEMETRIVSIFERSLTTSVNNIEHIESQSLNGVAVIKVFLQPTRRHQRSDFRSHRRGSSRVEAVSSRHHAASGPQL